MKINQIRIEDRQRPLGIDIVSPRLSWQIEVVEANFLQCAYQIQVAERKPDFNDALVWDSGKVVSEQSHLIPYAGEELKERLTYYFRIRIWNTQGEASEWSGTEYWEMGILQQSGWQAEWITAKANKHDDPSPYFRKQFILDKKVLKARVYASSLGLYELQLNGTKVGNDLFTPGWTNYTQWLQYQTYDVTEQLLDSQNVIGVVLGNGWFRGGLNPFRGIQYNIYGEELAALVQLHLTYEDGSEEVIGTDTTWLTNTGPILMSDLYNGEHYDARLEELDNSPWISATVLETERTLVAQIGNPARVLEVLSPVQLIYTPAGETVLDMGQNMVGWIKFNIKGTSGLEVSLQHAEVLDSEGNFYTENLRQARQMVTYICKGTGTETFQPHFTFQGFRYVKLTNFPADIRLEDFQGIVIGSTVEQTGEFVTSNPLINRLQANIQWGQKGNFLDVPTDCPQRDERLGWTGDAAMFASTAAFNYNVHTFFTKWLLDIRHEQKLQKGVVPIVVPNILGPVDNGVAGWSDVTVISPWTLYLSYGDQRILEEHYDSMKDWLEHVIGLRAENGLWVQKFQLGDWLALDGDPESKNPRKGGTDETYVANAFFVNSLTIFVKTATLLGNNEDAAYYETIKQSVLEAIREVYFDEKGDLTLHTQTAHVLALVFHLAKDEQQSKLAGKLNEMLERNNYHLTTGFLGTPFLCHALSNNGYAETAYRLLLNEQYPSWLYQVKQGATTIWERWNGIHEDGSLFDPKMNSFNHYAYGAIGSWMYQEITGLQIDENHPGYKKIIIHPKITAQLDYAYATLKTPYGWVRSGWKRQEDVNICIEVTIPPNTTANVYLENVGPGSLLINGEVMTYQQQLILGSGNYIINYKSI